MAALGDERLFELLERDGAAIAARRPGAFDSGRRGRARRTRAPGRRWRSCSPMSASAGRPAAGSRSTSATPSATPSRPPPGIGDLLHGEAVAYGLRAACRIGRRRRRDAAGSGSSDRAGCSTPLDLRPDAAALRARRACWTTLATDKKHPAAGCAGSCRPATGVEVRDDVDEAVVRATPLAVAASPRDGRHDPRPRPPGAEPQPASGRVSPRSTATRRSTRSTPASRRGPPSSGLAVDFFQSNHEGALIDRLHERDFDVGDRQRRRASPTPSVALRDALLAVQRPFVEVHLSDPSTREPFRHVNYLHDIAIDSIVGQGARGYHLALDTIAAAATEASVAERPRRGGDPPRRAGAATAAPADRRPRPADRRPAQRARRRSRARPGHEKAAAGRRAIRDAEREREVLLRVTMANEGPLPAGRPAGALSAAVRRDPGARDARSRPRGAGSPGRTATGTPDLPIAARCRAGA